MSDGSLGAALSRLIARAGAPVIRRGVDMAMRMMGEQFVTGETIAEALKRSKPLEARGFRYSYDMLGEAALTEADAQRYFQSYAKAIHAIGQACRGQGVLKGPGISIKLSALHPRYARAKAERVGEPPERAQLDALSAEATQLTEAGEFESAIARFTQARAAAAAAQLALLDRSFAAATTATQTALTAKNAAAARKALSEAERLTARRADLLAAQRRVAP